MRQKIRKSENPGPSEELCPGGTLLSHLETAVESRARKDVPYHGSGSVDSRVNGKIWEVQNANESFSRVNQTDRFIMIHHV